MPGAHDRAFAAVPPPLDDDPRGQVPGGLVLNVGGVTSRRTIDAAIHFQARLLAAVGEAIMAVDMASRIVYWNGAAERMYGWTATEAVGSDVLSLITGPEDASVVRQIANCLASGRSWTGDFWTFRKDGSAFPVLVTDTPVLDETGKLVAIIGVSTDITDRKAAEETSARLSAIVASSTDAIYSWALDGTIQTWNAGAERLFGFPAQEVVGGHVTAIEPDYDSAEVESLLKRIDRGEQIERFMTRRSRSDGAQVDISEIVSPIRDGAQIVGVSVIARDVTEDLRAHAGAVADRRRLLEAQQIAGVGSLEYAIGSDTMTWSHHLYRLLDVSPALVPSMALYLARIHPSDRASAEHAFSMAAVGDDSELTHRVRRSGGDRWARLRLRPDGTGLVQGTVLDITDRRKSDHERWEAEQRFAAGFEHAGIGMATATLNGDLTRINPKLCALLGRDEEELVGRPLGDLVHPDDRNEQLAALERVRSGQQASHQGECRIEGAKGGQTWVLLTLSVVFAADARPAYVFLQAQDISDRKLIEDALEKLALHDALTQLPNRLLLSDRLETALRRTKRDGRTLGVLFIDLDRFKLVNDSLGHVAGDQLLMQVAQRLVRTTAPADTVARFGGDEFVIVCELSGPEWLHAMCQRYLDTFSKPFSVDGNELYMSASIGATVARGTETPTALLRDADTAMYRAKESGRGRAELFGENLRGAATRRLAMDSALRSALELSQFRLEFQPVMDIEDGHVVGAEALIRWDHPTRGPVPPDEFVPLTEESGLIVPIGAWVLEEALRRLAEWRRLPTGRDLWMAVNLSARQLLDEEAVDSIIRIVRDSGLPPECICLELTETAIMQDAKASISALGALAGEGIRLSIDDFGTGYSSLSYLKQFPVSVLKIDQSFVAGLGSDTHDSSIVSAVVGLGRALGLELLAEGVENDTQLSFLRSLGVGLGQGFYWNPALPADEFEANLRPTATD